MILSLNMDLTINQLGLNEYTIKGVINIYTAQRMISVGKVNTNSRKDAIFVNASCWASQDSLIVPLDFLLAFRLI